MTAAVEHAVVELPAGAASSEGGYDLRGAALDLWHYKGHEVILAGPAETGKTLACLEKLDSLLWAYPGSQAVMVRKVRDTIYASCLQTYLRKILRPDAGVKAYGGERPQWFDYPNSSRLWVAGLDDPGKALSSERDFVYVNQAEEVSLSAWGVLCSRATGRAGNAPYPQVMGDCNPGPPHHWILSRSRDGGPLKLLHSRHEDNPTLYDDAGNLTEQGRRTMAVLEALPGLEYDRLCKGRWVRAEGVIYKGWNPGVHLIKAFAVPASWPRVWSVDFGYTNPFCWADWALDGDNRAHLVREIYHTKRTVADHAKTIRELTRGEPPPVGIVCDPEDANARATLSAELGLPTIPAAKHKTKKLGIQQVEQRLRIQGDRKPRLFVFADSLVHPPDPDLVAAGRPTRTADEFDCYVWADSLRREEPLDRDNHGMDQTRYLCHALDGPSVRDSGRPTVYHA